MRVLAAVCVLMCVRWSSGQSYGPGPLGQRGPPPQGGPPGGLRAGPVSFGSLPLARFPSLDGGSSPHSFRAAPVVDDGDDDDVSNNAVSPSPAPLLLSRAPPPSQAPYRRPSPAPIASPQQSSPQLRTQAAPPRRPPPPQRGGAFAQQLQDEPLEEELEEEKPDKLTLLLPQSKFNCGNRKTGYYADDGLNCEVFHYCQDNVRHSWICPEGFLFHQVHLICMPPSGDNICKQSSQFHFVNDYLYRPINAEEAQTKPNVTLRYSDRYYPDNYYEEGESDHAPRAAPVPVRPVSPVPLRASPAPPPARSRPAPVLYRPAPSGAPHQVFHSPEEVNIPLTQRRPPNAPQQRAYHPQHQQQQHDEDEFEYDDGPFRG